MAGTGAVFSLFPPENATGNFVKVVQRIPVKIVLDEGTDPPYFQDRDVRRSARFWFILNEDVAL